MSAEHDPRRAVLDASTPIRDAARTILETRLRAVRKRLESVREDDHAKDEDVHGLRVATRRASAALGVFGPVVRRGDRRTVSRGLRRLRRSAAIARGADVHGAMVSKMLQGASGPRLAACGYALGRIGSERMLGRMGLCESAKRSALGRGRRRDGQLVRTARSKTALGAATFGELAQIVIIDCFDRLELAMGGDLTSADRLHDLRLAVKRFRYRLEVLEPCLDPAALDEALARARALQQRLGEFNDLAELEARLERLAHELEDSDRAADVGAVIAGLRVIQGELDRSMREKREAFSAWWGKSGGHTMMASLRPKLLTLREPEAKESAEAQNSEGNGSERSPVARASARPGGVSSGGRP